jgi:hypothetical protein
MELSYETSGPGRRGATRVNWMNGRPHHMLREIMLANPTTSEARLQVMFEDAVRNSINPAGDDELLSALIVYFFTNRHKVILMEIEQATNKAPPTRGVQKQPDDFKEKVKETVSAIEQIVLLNQEMPNGKRRRNCTRKELLKFSKFDAMLAKCLKNDHDLLGSVIDEKEARKIFDTLIK